MDSSNSTVPLSIRRGDTLQLFVEYLDSNDVAVDVSGWAASFVVWVDAERLYVGSTESGDVTAGAGGYLIVVPEADVGDLPDRCWYEFRHKSPGGVVDTLFDGPLTVTGSKDGAFVV